MASGRYGTYGISQALVYGFAIGGLGGQNSNGLDVAFGAWHEASRVIGDRGPRVDPTDDPDTPYDPPDPDDGAAIQGDLNLAFGTPALAGLAQAAREAKRRSLVAAQVLVDHRPEASAAVRVVLRALSYPGSLMWVLRLLDTAGERAVSVIDECADILSEIAAGPYLTVRALARRLLGARGAPDPPASQADRALIDGEQSGIWTPAVPVPAIESRDTTEEMVSTIAGARLARAASLLPNLDEAVRERVAAAVVTEGYKKRMRTQLDAFADRLGKHWPDAYLAPEEVVEDALQRAAAGGRADHAGQRLPRR